MKSSLSGVTSCALASLAVELKFELIGFNAAEHDALVDEVNEYKRLCAAVGWSPGRRRS